MQIGVRNKLDRGLLFFLQVYGALAGIALALVPLRFLPADDAVILFQYSRNLAQHGAITFLSGGARVEGATDFAWMLLVALAIRVGIDPFWFCAAVNLFCLVALGLLWTRLAGERASGPRLLVLAGATAAFPQIFAAAAGFATLPDAVLLTLVVLFVVERRMGRASVSALVLCLFRPDGVVFAVPLLLIVIALQERRWWNTGKVAAFYIVPGLAYFAWRWHYFGEMLPLPFLVKSDAERGLGVFVVHSVRSSLIFLGFAGAVLWAAAGLRGARDRWLLLPLLLVPTVFYWSLRLDQNIGDRFFFYLPLSVAILLAMNWTRLQQRRAWILGTAAVAWILLIAMPLFRELRSFRDEQFGNVKRIAEGLARLPEHGRMVTSEAGFLPYFSGWETIDAWGLNTPAYAHRFFQSADVGRIDADLVVVHPERTDSCVARPDWQQNYADRTWPHLTRNMIQGARGYELWVTSYGSEYYRRREHWRFGEGDEECWLVKQDSPLRDGIVKVLEENQGVQRAR